MMEFRYQWAKRKMRSNIKRKRWRIRRGGRGGSLITARCGYPYLLQGSFSPKFREYVQGNEDIAMVANNCAIRTAECHDAGIPHHPLYKYKPRGKNQDYK